jgi:hypothetical protein
VKNGVGAGSNPRTRFFVDVIIGKNAGASAGLNDDLMAMSDQLANRPRYEADAKFVAFDFCRNADAHFRFPDAIDRRSTA